MAPYFSATSAISMQSVETITVSIYCEVKAESVAYWINGLSDKDSVFFRGSLLLPHVQE